MSVLTLAVKHGRTLPEARTELERVVSEVQTRFGGMIQRSEWSADRNSVKLFGIGFEIELRVDEQEVHVTGDIPFLSNLLGGPVMAGLKQILQQHFPKQLPSS